MVSLMLFRTFFIAFSAARHVFPSEISYAKVASGDSNLCMNLFASASALFKHRKNRKGTPGFERNAIKKNTPQQEWEKSLDSQTLPEYNFKLYKIFRYETELFF